MAELDQTLGSAIMYGNVLDQTMAEARTGFADLAPEAVEDLVDEAVTAVRRSRKSLPRPAR